MQLQKLEAFRMSRFTPDSRPSRNTVLKWIQEGSLPGKRIGGIWYVEVEAERRTTGDHLVDAVLEASR